MTVLCYSAIIKEPVCLTLVTKILLIPHNVGIDVMQSSYQGNSLCQIVGHSAKYYERNQHLCVNEYQCVQQQHCGNKTQLMARHNVSTHVNAHMSVLSNKNALYGTDVHMIQSLACWSIPKGLSRAGQNYAEEQWHICIVSYTAMRKVYMHSYQNLH